MIMKKYYFIDILDQIFKKKRESLLVFSLVLLSTVLLSITVFFKYNDSVDSSINNNLNLRYNISNNNLYGISSKKNEQNYGNSYSYNLLRIVQKIEEAGTSQYIENYDYNLVLFNLITSNHNTIELFGTRNHRLNEIISIVKGRELSESEIINGSNNILINESVMIDNKEIDIGDKIYIENEYNQELNLEFNVVGIYKNKDYNAYFDKNDLLFSYPNTAIISNEYIKNYLKKYDVAYDECYINNIYFDVSDYHNYERAGIELAEIMTDINDLTKPSADMYIDDLNNTSILESTSSIKNVFTMIFGIIFVLVCAMLFSTVFYFIYKKDREIYLYKALGQSNLKITVHYLIAYLIITVVALLAGIIVGYNISRILAYFLKINSTFRLSFLFGNLNDRLPVFYIDFISIIKITILIIAIMSLSVFVAVNYVNRNILKRK